eukprot:scaffold69586_cov51-Phaeocystis_antarctica.AAC.2
MAHRLAPHHGDDPGEGGVGAKRAGERGTDVRGAGVESGRVALGLAKGALEAHRGGAVDLHDGAVGVGVGGVQPHLREVDVVHGDHKGAAVLEPLAVVRLAQHVREVEERANVLDAAVGEGEAPLEDLLAIDHLGDDVGGEPALVRRAAEADRQRVVDREAVVAVVEARRLEQHSEVTRQQRRRRGERREAARRGHTLAAGAVAQSHGVSRHRWEDAREPTHQRARAARVEQLQRERGGVAPGAAVVGAEGRREAEEAIHLGSGVRPAADASDAAAEASDGAVEGDGEHVAIAVDGVGVVGVVGGEADDRGRREAAQRAADDGGDVGDGRDAGAASQVACGPVLVAVDAVAAARRDERPAPEVRVRVRVRVRVPSVLLRKSVE